MANVAQLVRAPDCGSGCRGFKSRLSPINSIFSSINFINKASVAQLDRASDFGSDGWRFESSQTRISIYNRAIIYEFLFR